MNVRLLWPLLLCGALSAGCASTSSTELTQSGFLSDYSKLQPDPDDPSARLYVRSGVDWRQYQKVLLEPIRVWVKDDADYKGVDPTELKALTDHFQQALVRALEPTYPVVSQPGPGVLRVRVAITDLVPTQPQVSVATVVVPFGSVASMAANTAGLSHLGQTAIEAEFLDSQTHQVLAAFMDRNVGRKFNFSQGVSGAINSYGNAFNTWAYARAAFDAWAQLLRQRLDEAHGQAR